MSESVKCVRDIREFPPESYRLPSDGRKWRAVCAERRSVAMQLATYANGDGTSIETGVARLMRETGIPRSTLFRRLDELRTLGILNSKHGLTKEHGTARRSLTVSKLRAPEVSDSESEVSDRPKPEVPISTPEVSDRKPEVSNGKTEVPNSEPEVPRICETQPTKYLTDKEPNRPKNQTDQPTENRRDGWMDLQQSLPEEMQGATATKAEREQLEALLTEHGGEGMVAIVKRWALLRDKGLGGLKNKWQFFLSEYGQHVKPALAEIEAARNKEAEYIRSGDSWKKLNERELAKLEPLSDAERERVQNFFDSPPREEPGNSANQNYMMKWCGIELWTTVLRERERNKPKHQEGESVDAWLTELGADTLA